MLRKQRRVIRIRTSKDIEEEVDHYLPSSDQRDGLLITDVKLPEPYVEGTSCKQTLANFSQVFQRMLGAQSNRQ